MTRAVQVLNGANLTTLGTRSTLVPGVGSYPELAELCRRTGDELGLRVQVRQTDDEGELVDWLHQAAATPVVLNGSAWTHTSIALRDACAARTAPLVEVHLSNTQAREPFRRHSLVSAVASGVITGFGTTGYVLALRAIAAMPARP